MMRRIFYSGLQRVLQYIYQINNKGLKVFMFHRVYNRELPILEKDIAISKDAFEFFINSIQKKGLEIISTRDIKLHLTSKYACITFDDVYRDAVENAIPYLIEKNIPFTIFITTDLIDSEQYISFKHIKEVQKSPLCTIGFHTNHHLLMREQKNDSICSEIDCSKLEASLGINIDEFAYPYGSIFAVNRYARKIAENMGYNHIFSTLSIPINRITYKRFGDFLPRININDKNFKKYC